MFIDLNTIGSEGLSFTRSIRLQGLEGPSRETIPEIEARIEGTITPAPGGAELNAHLGAMVPLMCSRCLETFPWDVQTEFVWMVLRSDPDAQASPGHGDPQDDAAILVAPEGKITLEDVVSEQIYLNLPLKPICTPTCKGLCAACGTNRNLGACACVTEDVDPRLAPLLQFKRKIQGS